MKREINDTGIMVSPIGLGGIPLSIDGRPYEDQAFKVIEAFVEGGGNFIDTANVYCLDNSDLGHNERLIHKALKQLGQREAVTVATKGGLTRPGGRWEVNGSPEFLRQSCEQSLKDLNTEIITLYQLHAVDPHTHFLDSLEELVRLKEEGKIMHIGLSNVSAGHLKTAITHTTVASVQNRCNPFCKTDLDSGMIDLCSDNQVTYIPYSPVGGHHGHVRLPEQSTLKKLAEKYVESSYCIALAWLLQQGEHILPIPGASRVESVRDSARAVTITLQPEDIKAIDSIPDD